MKDFFNDIFQYHLSINEQLAEQLGTPVGADIDRCKFLFCHLINAHQIWNARILQKIPLGVHDTHPLNECIVLNKRNYKETLLILNSFDLQTEIFYRNSNGVEFHNSIKEILFHIINHASHHRGQIIMELRNKGVEPIITDYIFYKR